MNTDGDRVRRESELNVRIIQSMLRLADELGTENRNLGVSIKLHLRVINKLITNS